MRTFLNGILAFIDCESLTDDEFNSLGTLTQDYTVDVYNALKGVLTARESVSSSLVRLLEYFQAKGVDVGTSAKTPTSQIFLGSPL